MARIRCHLSLTARGGRPGIGPKGCTYRTAADGGKAARANRTAALKQSRAAAAGRHSASSDAAGAASRAARAHRTAALKQSRGDAARRSSEKEAAAAASRVARANRVDLLKQLRASRAAAAQPSSSGGGSGGGYSGGGGGATASSKRARVNAADEEDEMPINQRFAHTWRAMHPTNGAATSQPPALRAAGGDAAAAGPSGFRARNAERRAALAKATKYVRDRSGKGKASMFHNARTDERFINDRGQGESSAAAGRQNSALLRRGRAQRDAFVRETVETNAIRNARYAALGPQAEESLEGDDLDEYQIWKALESRRNKKSKK